MPTYDYVCTSCKNRFDTVQSFKDAPLETCERCGGQLRRVFHPAAITFKGSGFYSTDNRRGGASPPKVKVGEKSGDSSGGSGSDGSSGSRDSGKNSDSAGHSHGSGQGRGNGEGGGSGHSGSSGQGGSSGHGSSSGQGGGSGQGGSSGPSSDSGRKTADKSA